MRLLLVGIVCLAACRTAPPAPAPSPSPSPSPSAAPPSLAPPDGSLAALELTRDRFVERAAGAGLRLSFTPGIREWTRPSIISWREEARTVAVPRWDELDETQRAALADMAGSTQDAPVLFAWLFRWFFIPHELAHCLQSSVNDTSGHAEGERFANDLAVAFYMEEPDGPARLEALERLLRSVVTRLPELPPDGDAYFDANYDRLGRDARLYGSFQLRFVLDSLRRRRELRFAALVGGLTR